MNILIIGLGYAGTRFAEACLSAQACQLVNMYNIATVNPQKINTAYKQFKTVKDAIKNHDPEIIIVSVNDIYRADVLPLLRDYRGFVICEKPFLCPWDNVWEGVNSLRKLRGFSLNLVERFSPATIFLKKFVIEHGLRLVRGHFTWGKDRLGDHRPTCGVTSELIHALDIFKFISSEKEMSLIETFGTVSDYSISGDAVPDTVSLLLKSGESFINGSASFTNVSRRREIGFIFATKNRRFIYAHAVYDDPEWDSDYLRIWEHNGQNERIISEEKYYAAPSRSGVVGINKLILHIENAINFVAEGAIPAIPFCDIDETISMQMFLNEIDQKISRRFSTSFSDCGEVFSSHQNCEWEKLG